MVRGLIRHCQPRRASAASPVTTQSRCHWPTRYRSSLGGGSRRQEAVSDSGLVTSAATVREDNNDGSDNYRLIETGLDEGNERSDKSLHLEQVTDGYKNVVCIRQWLHLASN